MSRPRRLWRPAVGDGLLVGGLVVLAGGIWMLRNGVLAGDPVFPRRVAPLGLKLFSGTHSASEPYDFALVHYLGDSNLYHAIFRQLSRTFGAPSLLAIVGSLGAIALAVRVRAGTVLAVAIASLVLLGVYVVTPYTAQGLEGFPQVTAAVRYALPAVALGAAAAAWFAGRMGRFGIPAAAGLALVAMIQAIGKLRSRGDQFHVTSLGTVLTTAFVLVVAGALAVRIVQARPSVRALAAGLAGVLVLVLLVGRDVQTAFDKRRYRGIEPALTWLQAVPKKPIRVGLAGVNGNNKGYSSPYIAFGPRLRNHVEYVGRRHKHLLLAYTNRAAFLAALQRGRYDVLLIGPEKTVSESTSVGHPREWARSAGWRVILQDSRFLLLGPPTA
jgi:hypothetical protein